MPSIARRVRHINHSKSGKSDGKTRSSFNRTIDLDDVTVEELRKRKTQVEFDKEQVARSYQDNDLVVCTSLGTHIIPRNSNRKWYALRKKVEVLPIRYHDLRHTQSTLMLLQGIPVKVVSERLGHASIKTTLDTYDHLLPSIQKESISIFSKNLFDPQ